MVSLSRTVEAPVPAPEVRVPSEMESELALLVPEVPVEERHIFLEQILIIALEHTDPSLSESERLWQAVDAARVCYTWGTDELLLYIREVINGVKAHHNNVASYLTALKVEVHTELHGRMQG